MRTTYICALLLAYAVFAAAVLLGIAGFFPHWCWAAAIAVAAIVAAFWIAVRGEAELDARNAKADKASSEGRD